MSAMSIGLKPSRALPFYHGETPEWIATYRDALYKLDVLYPSASALDAEDGGELEARPATATIVLSVLEDSSHER